MSRRRSQQARPRSHREALDEAIARVGPSALALADDPQATPADGKRKEAPATPRLGTHGQNYAQGILGEEWNEELQDWDSRIAKLEELWRGDSVVSATLRRPRTSILRATWAIEAGEGVPLLPSARASGAAAAPDEDRTALASIVLQANLLGIGPAEYRMRTTWIQALREAYNSRPLGVSFFEKTHRLAAGPLGTFQVIDGLYWMHPKSITKLFIDRNGALLGVLQEWKASYFEGTPDENATAKEEDIKRVVAAEDLFIVVCDLEGSNFLGYPRTRPMWADAKRRNYLSQAQLVDAQKRAVGIPYVKLGANAQGEAKEFAITQAKRLREGGNELSYVVMMDGDEVGFLDMRANVPDLNEVIRQQEARIRAAGAQEQFNLGQEGTGGSRAVASVNSEYYDIDVESTAEEMRSDFQRQLVEPLAIMNFPDVPTPQLRVANLSPPNIGAITQLAGAKGLRFRGKDEQHFRRIYKLPLLTDEELAEDEEMSRAARQRLLEGGFGAGDDGDDGDDDGDRPPRGKGMPPAKGKTPAKPAPEGKPAREPARDDRDGGPRRLAGALERGVVVEGIARRLWREPTPHEGRFLRLADIERGFDDFMRDWVQQVRSLREAAILEGIRKTRVSQKRAIVGRLRSAPLTDVISELGRRMREQGRQSAWTEIAQQVRELSGADGAAFDDDDRADEEAVRELLERAPERSRARRVEAPSDVVTELQQEADVRVAFDVEKILEDVIRGIERTMLQSLEEGMTEDEALDATRRALIGKSDFDLQSLARGHASKNFNDGRAEVAAQVRATLEKSPESGLKLGTVVRSEILDDATCDTCESLDGKVIEIDSDDYWEYMPPNKCQGGSRCRGFYVLVVERVARAA